MDKKDKVQTFVKGVGALVGKEIIAAAISFRNGEHILIINYIHEENVFGFDLPLDMKAIEKGFEDKEAE